MKIYLLSLLISCSLFAGTYNDAYQVYNQKDFKYTQEKDEFMYGDFKEIIRFDMLHFTNGYMDTDSNNTYETIVDTIKKYKQNNEKFKITVIGHTSKRTDEHNEVAALSHVYGSDWSRSFRFSQELNETIDNSRDFAQEVAKDLEDDGLDKNITVVEYRGAIDQGFTSGTDKGRDLSNRVMVSMYILFLKEKDSDKDTVFDSKDKCPKTPLGLEVDKHGCPLDEDEDGVLDYKDKCLGTPHGLEVDADGCRIAMTLHLNFANDSYVVPQESYDKIKEFADFLTKSPLYKAKLIGHTDSHASEEHNMILSINRAKATKEALVQDGISEERLMIEGKGELEPIATNDTEEGRAENRRTEITIFIQE